MVTVDPDIATSSDLPGLGDTHGALAAKKGAVISIGADDFSPTDTAKVSAKMGHHVSAHQHVNYQYNGHQEKLVNPDAHALKNFFSPAFKKTMTILFFGMVLVGFKILAGAAIGAGWFGETLGNLDVTETGKTIKEMLSYAIGSIPSGLLWFGTDSYLKHRHEAKEYNKGIIERMKEKLGLGRARQQNQETDITTAIETESPKAPRYGAPELEIKAVTGSIPALAKVDEPEPAVPKPTYVTKLVQDGPRSFSPREMAERLARDRAASAEVTV